MPIVSANRSYKLGSLDASNTMGAPGALEAATKDGSLNFIPGIDVAQWALLPQINPYTAPLGDVVQAVTTVYDSSDSTKVVSQEAGRAMRLRASVSILTACMSFTCHPRHAPAVRMPANSSMCSMLYCLCCRQRRNHP